jgi:hypothetical protein
VSAPVLLCFGGQCGAVMAKTSKVGYPFGSRQIMYSN